MNKYIQTNKDNAKVMQIGTCDSGGSSEPQILVQKRTEQGKQERRKHKGDIGVKWQTGNKQWERREDGMANTLTTNTKDNMLAEPMIVGYSRSREGNGKVTGRHLKPLANTLHTSTGSGGNTDQYVAEPMEVVASLQAHAKRTTTDGISPCITAACGMGGGQTPMIVEPTLRVEGGCLIDKDGRTYRIRKLTPRECFRLQDCEEEDIDKMMNAGISRTQLYKLAGNSICVAPMYHLFRKLFVEQTSEESQLSLF